VIDISRLGNDPGYRRGAERKGASPEAIDALIAADENRRSLRTQVENLRAQQNLASKAISSASPQDRPAQIAAAQDLKNALAALTPQLEVAEAAFDQLALAIPNPADDSVPSGGEEDYRVEREVGGQPPAPKWDHAEFGEMMGFVDSERAVRMSGSRFVYVLGDAVLLEIALVQWVMSLVVKEGFVPVVPPVLVREQMMFDAGFFPADRAQVYEVDEGELFLVGTSEVPLAGLHRGEALPIDDLPLRYAGTSSCFRREAGTYGKDTSGMFRVHQFDKVEMFSYCPPDKSWDELALILDLQERIVGGLGLPYRVITSAAADLGAPAAKKHDLEVFLPSQGKYREVTSCSNYTDYSARRLQTRMVDNDGNRSFVHTLNGTACAVGRILLNLFEHYQTSDGTLVVPDVLVAAMGKEVLTPRR
jgi:seryl-tRNA synthetase